MKKIIILSLFVLSAFVGHSQENYKAENEGWLVSIDEAYELSQKTGKPILANFTGSDWCGWCKRLTASVFVKKDFKKWADDNVILLELDFPRRTKLPEEIRQQNSSLQQAFQVRGYPTIWVFHLDKNAENGQFEIEGLGKTGYRKTVKEFTTDVDMMIAKYEKSK
ncbi:MAG: thioredoxin family protein [Saprospiraceae bacterium]